MICNASFGYVVPTTSEEGLRRRFKKALKKAEKAELAYSFRIKSDCFISTETLPLSKWCYSNSLIQLFFR